MKYLKPSLIAIVVILFIILGLQNTESVETRFLFATLTMPRVVLLMFTFLLGLICGGTGALWFLNQSKNNKKS